MKTEKDSSAEGRTQELPIKCVHCQQEVQRVKWWDDLSRNWLTRWTHSGWSGFYDECRLGTKAEPPKENHGI